MDGVVYRRHFDALRNPVELKNQGVRRIAALGDSADATVIRMEAQDARQKGGTTRITFYIGRDERRLPLRIIEVPEDGRVRASRGHGEFVHLQPRDDPAEIEGESERAADLRVRKGLESSTEIADVVVEALSYALDAEVGRLLP